MAEGAFIEVVEGVIGKSGNLADQIGLLCRVKYELERLRDTVSRIKPVVPHLEEREVGNPDFRQMLRQLKDGVYKADNLLEDFSTEVSRRESMTQNKKTRKVCISFPKLAYDLKKKGNIKAIRKMLDAVVADTLVTLQFKEHDMSGEINPFVPGLDDVIGREYDIYAIIRILLSPNVKENVAVLPIVGSRGLGKSTLAQLVYKDDVIQKHFQMRAWVRVGHDFNLQLIFKEIAKSSEDRIPNYLHRDTLSDDVHEVIHRRRYLLVLDDMWTYDCEMWDDLLGILSGGARGSRILVTTPDLKVARFTQTFEPYFLRGLNKHDSWSLFKKRAFVTGQEPKNLIFKDIGMGIVEKCGGIPLAIKVVGDKLHSRNSEEEWLTFKDYEISKADQIEYGMMPAIKLSYNNLPSHLKQCYAYCSLFPKDYTFKRQTLIRLWMAQGFIKLSNQNPCLEDVGHEYFTELLSRSLFQEVEEDKRGDISFKIHDIMYDLLLSVARQENTIFQMNVEHIDEQTRHLSFGFHLGLSSLIAPLFQTSNLRTLLLCGQQSGEHENGLNESTCDAIVSQFKFLRVLDLHETGIKTVPNSISKLSCLRYLDLSNNRLIEMLPKSLFRLQNLQTLKLSGCVRLKELPRDISKLVNLRFLEIDGCRNLTHMPCGLGQLTNLQTLSHFVMSKDASSVSRNTGDISGKLKELNSLNNLRGTLEIVNLRHGKDAEVESKATNLKGIEHLQALGLCWIEDEVDKEDVVFDEPSLEALQPHQNLKVLSLYRYRGVRFPAWLYLLTNLVEFSLFGCKNGQHIPPFPSLKILELNSLPALEYISHGEEFSNSSFFPSLEELKIKYCPILKGWWQRRDFTEEVNGEDDNFVGITTTTASMAGNHLPPSFPRLSKLCIWACPQLISMPLFPFLQKLELYYCSFKPLEETTRTEVVETVVASTSSSTDVTSSFAPLSKLESMEIGRMEEPLPKKCMQNLSSLNHLWIYECRGSYLQGMQHLTALKQLEICSSEVFHSSNDGNRMEWQGLRTLSSLWLVQLLKLEFLPAGIQHITFLRNLTIDNCPCLMALPEWISSLTSLEILEILQCPNLRSLPVGISRLTSLHTLKIRYCPILLKRCKKETGEDWPKIVHIPNLNLEEGNSDGESTEQQKKLDLLRIRA